MKTKLQSKKHYIIDAIIILVVAGLTFFYLAKNGIITELNNLSKISAVGIITICLIMFVSVLFHSFVYYKSNLVTNSKLNFTESINTYLMGYLGSGITPLKIGHYPFIFYYYSKKNISFEKSLGNVCINQIVFSLTTILIYFIIMLLCLVNHTTITISGTIINLWLAALAGFIFNLVALILVILLAYSKPFHNLIVKTSSLILIKLKKIQSREQYETDHAYKMQIYKEKIDYVFKHLHKFIVPILSFFLYMIFFCSIPYIIYLFFTNSSFSMAEYVYFFSLNQAMTYITNIVPVPGGTGVAEFSFLAIFGTVFAENTVGAAMIIWRVLTYYIPILIAFVIFLIIMAVNRNNKKNSMFTNNFDDCPPKST